LLVVLRAARHDRLKCSSPSFTAASAVWESIMSARGVVNAIVGSCTGAADNRVVVQTTDVQDSLLAYQLHGN
jgi:hypothetical protein